MVTHLDETFGAKSLPLDLRSETLLEVIGIDMPVISPKKAQKSQG